MIRAVVAWTLAVLLPLTSWGLAGLRDPLGVVPFPFGEMRMLVVQWLVVLPLAVFVARGLPRWRLASWLGLLLGTALAIQPLLSLGESAPIMPGYDQSIPTGLAIHIYRVVLVFLMLLGFAYAALGIEKSELPACEVRRPSQLIAFALLALLPTYLFASQRAHSLRQQGAQFMNEHRYWLAWKATHRADCLAGRDSQGTSNHLRNRVEIALHQAQSVLATESANTPSWRAIDPLLELEQLMEARRVLIMSDVEPSQARLHWIEVARREEDWELLMRWLGEPSGKLINGQLDYDLLAMAYRGMGRWSDAEKLYLRLLQADLPRAAYWHLQIAKHYQLSGRPRLALKHFELASEDERLRAIAVVAGDQLRMTTPACLLHTPAR
jgi:tetratricopeptide (TPR) repeat protein